MQGEESLAVLGEPLHREEGDHADLLESRTEQEQHAEHEDHEQHDDRADAAEQRVERRPEQRAEQSTGVLEWFERVATRTAMPDVQQSDDRRADEDDPEPEPEVARDSPGSPARDEHPARGDEQRERHDDPARAEHDRCSRIDRVADRTHEIRVDAEHADEREHEEPDHGTVGRVAAELAGQLLAPLGRGPPARHGPARRAGPFGGGLAPPGGRAVRTSRGGYDSARSLCSGTWLP